MCVCIMYVWMDVSMKVNVRMYVHGMEMTLKADILQYVYTIGWNNQDLSGECICSKNDFNDGEFNDVILIQLSTFNTMKWNIVGGQNITVSHDMDTFIAHIVNNQWFSYVNTQRKISNAI